MKKDTVDIIVEQWRNERPDLNSDSLHIISRIFRLARRFEKDASEVLKPFGLEHWEYDVLAALLRHGAPYSLPALKLAEVCLCSSGAGTNRITRLEEKGLVERINDDIDRRRVMIKLTKKGEEIMNLVTPLRLQRGLESISSLNSSEQQELIRILKELLSDGPRL